MASEFVAAITNSLFQVPYGIRWLCSTIVCLVKVKMYMYVISFQECVLTYYKMLSNTCQLSWSPQPLTIMHIMDKFLTPALQIWVCKLSRNMSTWSNLWMQFVHINHILLVTNSLKALHGHIHKIACVQIQVNCGTGTEKWAGCFCFGMFKNLWNMFGSLQKSTDIFRNCHSPLHALRAYNSW